MFGPAEDDAALPAGVSRQADGKRKTRRPLRDPTGDEDPQRRWPFLDSHLEPQEDSSSSAYEKKALFCEETPFTSNFVVNHYILFGASCFGA